MNRISTNQWYRQGVDNMLHNQARLSRTQLQLATGQRLLAPSDDPGDASRALQLDQLIADVAQYQRNADRADSRLVREEKVLESAGNIFQRVRELAVQGLNDSYSAQDRRAMAQEVRENLEALLAQANERDSNGEYLFSGYRSGTIPFVETTPGVFEYQGDQGQRLLRIGAARHVATNDPGDAVFMNIDDGAGGRTNAFAILHDLAQDLEADTLSDEVLTRIDNAMDRLSTVRSRIGSRLQAIDNQRGINDSFKLLMEEDRSNLRDLDYAEAVSRMQQQMLMLQASQQSFLKVEGLSLFNYF